jgi:fructosamine-3-kinase
MHDLRLRTGAALGREVVALRPLGSGATGSVVLAELRDGSSVVVKTSSSAAGEGLAVEARSLRLLAERSALPVPRVIHVERDLLVMEYVAGRSSFDERAERHAAELLADLHCVRSAEGRFGLEFDALIGPLHQPNGWSASWVEFWRDRRVMHMAVHAAREGRLGPALEERLELLGKRLGEVIPDAPAASLLHGDVWSGNVLAEAGRVVAFLDPAPYYGPGEAELAFVTMFSTFGRGFFARYAEVAGGIDAEFWSVRRHVYMIYPLLVHVRLFGGGYVDELSSVLDTLGF